MGALPLHVTARRNERSIPPVSGGRAQRRAYHRQRNDFRREEVGHAPGWTNRTASSAEMRPRMRQRRRNIWHLEYCVAQQNIATLAKLVLRFYFLKSISLRFDLGQGKISQVRVWYLHTKLWKEKEDWHIGPSMGTNKATFPLTKDTDESAL